MALSRFKEQVEPFDCLMNRVEKIEITLGNGRGKDHFKREINEMIKMNNGNKCHWQHLGEIKKT